MTQQTGHAGFGVHRPSRLSVLESQDKAWGGMAFWGALVNYKERGYWVQATGTVTALLRQVLFMQTLLKDAFLEAAAAKH